MIFSEYKNILANKFMRDTNYIIIKDTDDLEELERQWELFKTSLTTRQQRLSDDRSIQIWNMTNQEHYETLKKELIQELKAKLNIDNTIINEPEEDESSNEDDLISNDNFEGFDEFEDFEPEEPKNLVNIPDDTEIPDDDNEINEPIDISNESFVGQIYNNMQIINEQESNKRLQHRRLNDTPYFTPSEMIDMGVHGNDNYYCPVADNDGLITNILIPTWFDSYKDMCLDHIFEDYTKEWIDTLDMLYSDFDSIKESGDEDKILARKQSILDLGWNPEIPFTRRNRQLASKRVSKLLDKSSSMNLFINLDKEVPDEAITDEPVTENASKDTHQPIYIVFVQGKSPIISNTIKKVTNSPFSHSGISFDSKLDNIHSYNMAPKPGVVKETLSGYKDNVITVMAFFAPTDIYNTMKDTVMDYYINAKKTVYDWGIIFNKLINKNARVVNDKYHQVCSTFVDTVLKSGKVTLDKDANVPSPAELYNATKSMPNKIIEVYSGPADKYDSTKVDKKMNKLLEKGTKAINEGIHDIMNGTNPFSTKIFYHISFDDNLDDEILKPRIPSWITKQMKDDPNFIKELEKLKDPGSTEGYGFEEYKTPRVCLSNSIEGCLNAIINEKGRMHLAGETLYVYIPEKPIGEYKTKSNKQILKDGDVFDANTTNEIWILEPVKMKYVGSIVVDKITGEHIKKFANNKNKTNIKYDYKWHWFHKVKYRYNPEKNKFVTEASISEIINKIKNHNKYEAPLPSIAYENDKPLSKPIRRYTFEILPIEIFDKYKDDPYITDENIKNATFAPYNLKETTTIPKNKHIYQVAYCNDKYNVIIVYEDLDKVKQYLKSKNKTLDDYNLKPEGVTNVSISSKWCYINKEKNENLNGSSFVESASVLNEVKQFPIEFDQDGNLIIYKARIGSIAYGDEIDDSVKLLESYRNENNVEGIKYELAKLWFINDSIEKKLKKRLNNDEYKELIDQRATCLNVFKLNLEYVMKAEKGFNFSDYYNSTPFSDNSVKITANTLKYSIKALTQI